MAVNPIKKTYLNFVELMAHWECSENDLFRAIINKQLIPSVHVNAPLWELKHNAAGKRVRQSPAVFVNDFMYLVGVSRQGIYDCKFTLYSRQVDPGDTDSLFKAVTNQHVDNHLRMCDVVTQGCFTLDAINQAEANTKSTVNVATSQASVEKQTWWQSNYDVLAMARELEKEYEERGQVNQSGKRSGKVPISTISAAIAKRITDAESKAHTSNSIVGKSVTNYLTKSGWK